MPGSKPDKMKSINIQMTDSMEAGLETFGAGSRSANVRMILIAILSARRDGNRAPLAMAIENAASSTAGQRRAFEAAGGSAWHKSIVWIPMRMHREIERLIDREPIHVSDLIRGAVLGATGADPAEGISRSGSELWGDEVIESS